jgi:methylenetetrahydrofolate reductase (NADPH)
MGSRRGRRKRMSSFARALSCDRLIVTAECLPPRGSDPEAVRAFSSALPSGLDAIVVADNPDEIRSSAFSAARILKSAGNCNVVLSMATRDRNRIALLSDVFGAAALGFAAVLCVSGRHQSMGVCPQAAAVHDFDSIQFIQALKKMILDGSAYDGKEVQPKLEFEVGAAVHPYMRPMELNLLRLKKKIVAGADFVLTQAAFDLHGFNQWMDAVRAAELEKRTVIIAGVLPLTSVDKARALQRTQVYGPIPDDIIERIAQSSDAVREGVEIASEVAAQLMEIRGVRGIHILNGGCDSASADVLCQITTNIKTRRKKTGDVSLFSAGENNGNRESLPV